MTSTQSPTPIHEITQLETLIAETNPWYKSDVDSEDELEKDNSVPKPSGFDRIINDFAKLDALLLNIENGFNSTFNIVSSTTTAPDTISIDNNNNNNAEEMEKTMLRKDVKHIRSSIHYIKNNVNGLKNSPYSDKAEDLLQLLMDFPDLLSVDHFMEYSDNLNHLLEMVTKLKYWVPRRQHSFGLKEDGYMTEKMRQEMNEIKRIKCITKMKKGGFIPRKEKGVAVAEIVKTLVNYDPKEWGMSALLKSYGELEVRDKLCLLCFSVFPCDVEELQKKKRGEKFVYVRKNLVIKKKVLIYWWVGEGFIDRNPQETPNSHVDDLDCKDLNATMSTEGYTIEEIGEKILQVLREKGFIEPVMRKGRISGSYQMHPFVHSFITALAMRAGFFDFRKVDGTLSTSFTLSQRACLLKTRGDSLSSCRRWKQNIDNWTELNKFTTVRTLFNVNESTIDIKPEWFSKMKYLSVLYLGSWHSQIVEHIQVADQTFMEGLKNMKQLKLLSLQGVATTMKLPDSVCKLGNLIILDLRACQYMEELPAGIGSLKNLTHLDISNCHLLTKLPIGISLLSKLEVLKGFVVYNQAWWKKAKGCVPHDFFRSKNKEFCTLRDLLNLVNLRELSLDVNRDDFPNQYEVKVFRKMTGLGSLKITWTYDFKKANHDQSRPFAHQCGRCTYDKETEGDNAQRRGAQPAQNINGKSGQKEMKNLEKLKLWCFPCQIAPDWLVPNQLKKLKKLHINGGNLKSLNKAGAGDAIKWEVEMLRFKYLSELEFSWGELNEMFPKMKYLEKDGCRKMGLFPCDHEGVWRRKE